MIHIMKKTYRNITIVLNKLLPIILITLSIYIYKEISDENKKLREKIETLTTLVSYKTSELLEQVKDTSSSKK